MLREVPSADDGDGDAVGLAPLGAADGDGLGLDPGEGLALVPADGEAEAEGDGAGFGESAEVLHHRTQGLGFYLNGRLVVQCFNPVQWRST